MSSKKVAPKKDAKAAKKPAAKSASKTAAKAPAKKTATASAAKKPAKAPAKQASKPAAKPAAKAPAKSSTKAAKPVAKAAKAPTKPSKASTKPVKAPAKAPAKAAVKQAPKQAPKKAPKAPAKEAVVETKKAAAAKVPAKKAPVKEAPKRVPEKEIVTPKPEEKAPKAEKPAAAPVEKPKSKNAPDYDYAVLLQGVKRLSKTIMFVKVDESEDRSNKKKMSSDVKNLDLKPTSPIRHKASLAEETQEELTERILKELEEQNRIFEREAATQMCTRCNRNLVSPEFWVDKHLGFCEECAAILKLGQSKEARKVEYQLGAMDGDSLDEEDDDIIGPDADDLKAAEEDLADMED